MKKSLYDPVTERWNGLGNKYSQIIIPALREAVTLALEENVSLRHLMLCLMEEVQSILLEQIIIEASS